jgi:hypothetical protein
MKKVLGKTLEGKKDQMKSYKKNFWERRKKSWKQFSEEKL